jgi:SAM-dependent methyltransferase
MADAAMAVWASQQKGYWDGRADDYEGFYQDSWSALENEALVQRLRELNLPDSPNVLDLGCGTGLGGTLVKRAHTLGSYVGVDISPRMLEQARERQSNAILLNGPVEQVLPTVPAQAFDLVLIIFSTLSYFADPATTLKKAHRALRPGGRIVASALGALSLRRLVRLRTGLLEAYNTRGATAPLRTPAWTFTPRRLRSITVDAGFDVSRVVGEGALAGVAERSRLWGCSEFLSRILPATSHTICVEATKR